MNRCRARRRTDDVVGTSTTTQTGVQVGGFSPLKSSDPEEKLETYNSAQGVQFPTLALPSTMPYTALV